jgi:aryl-alcohol dehydrogenase-like predicted oxidoreductase
MISKQRFGRTGHDSTRTIFGAAALWAVDQAEADRTLDVLLEYGVNHIDTAASYGDSELRVGPWMERHRGDFFLATKTLERTYEGARHELHRSLERLRTDHVDLLQLHYLVDPAQWEVALGPGGALEAAVEARQQGLVRFIGVTGHGTSVAAMHLRSLERFSFDSVLLPCNFPLMQNPRYAADFEALVAACRERDVAIQTIKSLAAGQWSAEGKHAHSTWYEPLEEQEDVDRAVHWVLGKDGLFLNTAGDTGLLPKVLDAASRFERAPSEDEMREMAARCSMRPLFVNQG